MFNSWQVLCEKDDNGDTQRWFIYGNFIDEPLVMIDSDDDQHYYTHDHLFSTVALIDDQGNVIERYEYNAYGQPTIYNSDFSQTYDASQYGNPYMFTGRHMDSLDNNTKKLGYNRRRYLDYHTGRWLQQNRLDYINGMNVYEYGRSTPSMAVCKYGTNCASCHDQHDPVQQKMLPSNPVIPSFRRLNQDPDPIYVRSGPLCYAGCHGRGTSLSESGTSGPFLERVKSALIDHIKSNLKGRKRIFQEVPIAKIPPWGSIDLRLTGTAKLVPCCHPAHAKPQKKKQGHMIDASVELAGLFTIGTKVRFVKHSRGEIKPLLGGRYKPQNPHKNNQFVGGYTPPRRKSETGVSLVLSGKMQECKTDLDGKVGLQAKFGAELLFAIEGYVPIGSCSFSKGCQWEFDKSRLEVKYTGGVGVYGTLKASGSGSGTIIVD